MAAVPLPVVRLDATAGRPDLGPPVTGTVQLAIGGTPVSFEMTVPAGPASVGDLLPVFRSVTNAVVDVAEAAVARAGRAVSCRAGCGACCRQSVPVSASEAHALRRLADALPEPRRTAVRDRFADAVRQLDAAGILAPLRGEARPGSRLRDAGLAYFRAGVPCPFLEDESCSIHPDRPLACREYLVTSPAASCASPTADTIEMVPLSAKPSRALMEMDVGWTLLVLALEWAEANPEPTADRPGPEVVRAFVGKLAGGGSAG